MEKIIFVIGIVVFCSGAISFVISGILANLYSRRLIEDYKRNGNAQPENLEKPFEDAALIVFNVNNIRITEGDDCISIKVSKEAELKRYETWVERATSVASFHLMLVGGLIFVGSLVGCFENKAFWILTLVASIFVPRLMARPLCFLTRLVYQLIKKFIK